MDYERKVYSYWFSNIRGLSTSVKANLINNLKSAVAILDATESDLKDIGIDDNSISIINESKKKWDFDGEYKKLCEKEINYVSIEDCDFPIRLRNLNGYLYSLYYIGSLPASDSNSVGIVGSRKCTSYGKYLALKTGEVLATNGIEVISGLAKGIDSFSHEGALNGNGKTFAVLGCGVNIVYPTSNWKLYERIVSSGGGIISEYPPDTSPKPLFFPQRNRIISGLSDAVIVVEAAKKSGSLITADYALEQGKDVFAYPGRIGDPFSEGTNNLIKQGAGMILSPSDLLSEIDITIEKKNIYLEKGDKLVYSLLDLHPKSIETICDETSMEPAAVVEILFGLMERGLVSEIYRNHYIASYD